jgi:hypothetical protein
MAAGTTALSRMSMLAEDKIQENHPARSSHFAQVGGLKFFLRMAYGLRRVLQPVA